MERERAGAPEPLTGLPRGGGAAYTCLPLSPPGRSRPPHTECRRPLPRSSPPGKVRPSPPAALRPHGPGALPHANVEVQEATPALTVRRNWISSSPSPPSAMAAPLSSSPGRCSRCPGGRRRSLPSGRQREPHGRAAPGWGKGEGGGAGSPSPALAARGVQVPVSLQQGDSSAQPPRCQCRPRGSGMRLTGGGGGGGAPRPPHCCR